MVAALFVAKNGPYFGLEGVDPWDRERDARKYNGPWPVVAHPDCGPWGKYATGGPNPKAKRKIPGDDKGCFDRALWAVRNFGGVIEHPAYTKAFPYYGICAPNPAGSWQPAGDGYGAWVCHVHQGHYGHPADKATWLYVNAPRPLPELIWGPALGKTRLEEGFHSKEERARARCRDRASQTDIAGRADSHAETLSRSARSNRRAKEAGLKACEFLSSKQRAATPPAFRDLLIGIARGER